MKNNFTIFYSWQSDIRRNRNFIQSCLEKSIKEIKKKEQRGIELEISIDRDTSNKSGSPEIANTIFQKITTSDIFVCDVTVVNKSKLSSLLKYRLTPNPNVLIELGYAVSKLGWERVICINDTRFSAVEDLPFDIRGHRITFFESTKENSKEILTLHLKNAIEHIIDNYDNIISNQSKNSLKFHDFNIYNQVNEICSEVKLLDGISLCVNSLFIWRRYLDYWDNLQEFYKLSINIFLDIELNDLFISFLKQLDDFDTIVVTFFHPKYDNDPDDKQEQMYVPDKRPFNDETWADCDKRILKLQEDLSEQGEKVRLAYRNFIVKVKQKLI